VVFIKEIVPKPAITFVANTLFKERYQTLSMSHDWQKESSSQIIKYQWGGTNQVSIKTGLEAEEMIVGSEEEFIAEHYLGYSQSGNQTFEYEVKHPKWKIYPVIDFSVMVDFGANYGATFEFLNHQNPQSVLLAEGSEISVLNKTKL
jgi:hypothetical protein